MSEPWWEGCIECHHVAAVHGITDPTGWLYAPCDCCEAPHVLAATQDHQMMLTTPRVPRPERKAS